MKWFLFTVIIIVLLYQYRKGLISTADADTGVILALGLGLVKL